MPIWTFATESAGPVVPVVVSLPVADLAVWRQTTTAPPPMLSVRGLIDTGTDISAIPPRIVQQLGLIPDSTNSTTTAAGPATVDLFRVALVIHGPDGPVGDLLVDSDLLVLQLPAALPDDLDVLVGRDMLDRCLFAANGPAKNFLLAF